MKVFLVVVITLAFQGDPVMHKPLIYPTPYESRELCNTAKYNPGLGVKTWLYKEAKAYNEMPGWSTVNSLTAIVCATEEELEELKEIKDAP